MKITDKNRLDFIEERIRHSRNGVKFDWDGSGLYRYFEHHKRGGEDSTVRGAIDKAIKENKWSKKA